MKRLLLISKRYSIEPLGLMHLAGVVKSAGVRCKIVLLDESGEDHAALAAALIDFEPDVVGIQVWTGGHQTMFTLADSMRRLGYPTIIGGPHATYFADECLKHADWVVRGHGYRLLLQILLGQATHGILFDEGWSQDMIPMPVRTGLYRDYPQFAESPIKSMIASVGCPYSCTYCYAPVLNEMYGGFRLHTREVDHLVQEGQALKSDEKTKLVFFQDDVFGFDVTWLREFSARWREEVGLPFHCQIRIELTLSNVGSERLDLLAAAGCTGITLAIESGNEFLRDHVLFRHMDTASIRSGCEKITTRGMTLRIEQILAVPFSNLDTDLQTLQLNREIKPTMAWCSILAPYGGTNMGTIASRYRCYSGTNDDLSPSFFESSRLRHVEGGPTDIKRIVDAMGQGAKSKVLLKMHAEPNGDIMYGKLGKVGAIRWLSDKDNEKYNKRTARLQSLFLWLARMPRPTVLARQLLDIKEWTWAEFAQVVREHISEGQYSPMGWYFDVFANGHQLQGICIREGVFKLPPEQGLAKLGTLTRRHVYDCELYKIVDADPPTIVWDRDA
jgi:radical SAM superfamily enzyme YgiQ (UPF0313 family)